jgi:hypothetical protein
MVAFAEIRRVTKEEAAAEFKRTGSNLEKLDQYIDTLRGMDIGEAITVSITGQWQEQKVKKDGKDTGQTVRKWVDLVPATEDEDGMVDTVRTFKRRMNAAAESLDFKLKWKNKGHRVGEGEESRFVMDWLSGLAVESSVEVSDDDGEDGIATGK